MQLFDGIGEDLTFDPGDAATSPGVTLPDANGGDAHASSDAGPDAKETSAPAEGGENAGDANEAGDAFDAGPHDDAGCPATGTPMVRIDTANGNFCIDVRETTVKQFNDYLIDHPSMTDGVPPVCKVAPFVPVTASSEPQDNPVDQVNLCYAWDYCGTLGKRLCGKIGGGHVTSLIDSSEWYFACTNGKGQSAFPYGSTYDASACQSEGSSLSPVGSHAACHGIGAPFERIFDMSGNVGEYEDNAGSYDGSDPNPMVKPRGGAAGDGSGTACASESDDQSAKATGNRNLGIRCCADPI